MKRKYHPNRYRPNGSLRVEAFNYGTVCDTSRRELKQWEAEEDRAYADQEDRISRRLRKIEKQIGPRRMKQAYQTLEASSLKRAAMTKTTRRIFDISCAMECQHQDEQLLRYAIG